MNKQESAEWWSRILAAPLPTDRKPEGVADTLARVRTEIMQRKV